MFVIVHYNKDGKPKEGLSPTIKIRDADTGNIIVENEYMTEVGDGYYKYPFTDIEENKEYLVICYSGEGLPENQRYSIGGIDTSMKPPQLEDIVKQTVEAMEREDGTLDLVKQVELGRWIIKDNQMIFYREDNETEIARYRLFDMYGTPTVANVFERYKE